MPRYFFVVALIGPFFYSSIVTAANDLNSEIRLQLGVGHNNTQVANYPSGVPDVNTPTIREEKNQFSINISGYAIVSDSWKFGLGTAYSSGELEFENSLAVWSIDVFKVEYSPIEVLSARFNFGVSKQFESKTGYGKQYQFELLYNLSKNYSVGIGQRTGNVDQEQRDGQTDYIGGEYQYTNIFVEIVI